MIRNIIYLFCTCLVFSLIQSTCLADDSLPANDNSDVIPLGPANFPPRTRIALRLPNDPPADETGDDDDIPATDDVPANDDVPASENEPAELADPKDASDLADETPDDDTDTASDEEAAGEEENEEPPEPKQNTAEPREISPAPALSDIKQLRRNNPFADKNTPAEHDVSADDADEDETVAPLATTKPLTEAEIARRERIRRCLAIYYQKTESVSSYSPWGLMHAMITYGSASKFRVNNREVNAIGYLCWNGAGRGQRLFELRNGRIHTPIGPGYQGHQGQFLAMLAQSRVKSDFPLKIQGRDFTVQDLVEHEMRSCRTGEELTFILIGLVHYLKSDTTWKNGLGEEWDIPRVIRDELRQPVVGAACGGSHRMMGFSYAVRKRERRGEPIEGQWKRAKKYVDDYHDYTLSMQNPDGSFSTNWFEGRGNDRDIARRMQTTGHILEWLIFSLPQERLRDRDIVTGIDYLTDLMLRNTNKEWEIGPRGHALRAMVLYNERVFGTGPADLAAEIAETTRSLRLR